jgi:hypothetical protein
MIIDTILCKFHKLLTPQRMKYPYIVAGFLWLGWIISIIAGEGNADLTGTLVGTDFSAFYSAAKIILSGNSQNLYDLFTTNAIQQELYTETSSGITLFLNPPHFALLMVPFGLLPYLPAVLLWMTLGICSLWYSIRLISEKGFFRIFILSLTWLPVFAAVSFGQNSFFTLLIFCLTYYFLKREKFFVAGLIFSLLLYKPQYLLFLGFLWLLNARKNKFALIGLGLGLLLQIGFNLLLLPEASSAYIDFFLNVSPKLTQLDGFPVWNTFSTKTFWEMLLPNSVNISQVLYLLGLIFGLVGFRVIWRRYSNDLPIIFSVMIVWMIWSLPYISLYDWTVLIIPAILLWDRLPDHSFHLRSIYAFIWLITLISNSLAFIQYKYLGFAIQLSVPALLISVLIWYFIVFKGEKFQLREI